MTYLPLPPLGQTTKSGSLPVTLASDQGNLAVNTNFQTGTPTTTTPDFASGTSTTLLAANSSRKYVMIQNNSGVNVMISLSGATLTGIVPTSTNQGIVLTPGDAYENPTHYCPTAIITGYHASGGTINTVTVVEA